MDGPSTTLSAHSPAEALLYLMVTPCALCEGMMLVDGDTVRRAGETLSVPATCRACDQRREIAFTISEWPEMTPGSVWPVLDAIRVINSSDDPSQIVDVCGWLTLHSMIVERSRSVEDRVVVRRLQILAGLCLDEALKFYDEDNDLPPAEAFYRESSRQQFRDRPELFALQRLIEQRGALPSPSAGPIREADSKLKNRKHWWSRKKR